jgi:hypothetical protein
MKWVSRNLAGLAGPILLAIESLFVAVEDKKR